MICASPCPHTECDDDGETVPPEDEDTQPLFMGWISLPPEQQEAVERAFAASQISQQGMPCPHCERTFRPIDSRWLCPHCGAKVNCCEGQPLQLDKEQKWPQQ